VGTAAISMTRQPCPGGWGAHARHAISAIRYPVVRPQARNVVLVADPHNGPPREARQKDTAGTSQSCCGSIGAAPLASSGS